MKHYISRRKFLIASGIAAAATALTACGGTAASTESTSTSASTSSEAGSSSEATMEPTTLRWVITSGGGKQKDADMVAEKFNEQLQEILPGITVEFDYWMPSEYKEKFDLAMAGGEQIDIAWKGYMMQTSEYFQMDTFVDLAPYLAGDADLQAELPEFLIAGATIDGTLCYMPKYEMHHWLEGIYTPKAAYDEYFDREAFDAAAADYVATSVNRYYTPELFDVLENYMAAADAGGMLGSGYSPYVSCMNKGVEILSGSSGLQNCPFPLAIKVPVGDGAWDTTIVNNYEVDETRAYFAKLADWKAKGYMRNDLLTLENPRQYENTNVEGDLIWYHNYVNADDPTSTGLHERLGAERGWDADYNVIPLGTPVLTNGSSDGICIPWTAQNPDVSYQVLRLMFNEDGKELRNTLIWGIEDVHYTKTGDNRIEVAADAGPQEDDTYGVPTWGLGNCHKTWLLATQPDNQYDYYADMVAASSVSPTVGFNYNMGDFDADVTNIRNVVAQYVPSFNAGDYTEALYDEFLAALAETKIAEVQADLQTQLDAYVG